MLKKNKKLTLIIAMASLRLRAYNRSRDPCWSRCRHAQNMAAGVSTSPPLLERVRSLPLLERVPSPLLLLKRVPTPLLLLERVAAPLLSLQRVPTLSLAELLIVPTLPFLLQLSVATLPLLLLLERACSPTPLWAPPKVAWFPLLGCPHMRHHKDHQY